jgi:hypothetical protein
MGPMRVAYYSYVGRDPETQAWDTLLEWAQRQPPPPRLRFFGFSNPPPSDESAIYGFEAWMTVSDRARGDDAVRITQVQASAYAAMHSTPQALRRGAWKRFEARLDVWMAENYYRIDATRPWLREHIPAVGDLAQLVRLEGDNRWVALELLMPIKPALTMS